MSERSLIIGSRGSVLARWQADSIAGRLEAVGISTRIEIIKTTGDHLQTASLSQASSVAAGGKGLFTKEIEEALLAGGIDLAVHSLKDLPTDTPEGLVLAAIPERDDPRDVMAGKRLEDLPRSARVGTSSLRRAAQLLALRPDLDILPIRGNVDTRLRKLKEGQFDSIVLAAAGLRRLGLADEIVEILEPERMCPAPGQGALAVETRESGRARDWCALLNHEPTEQAVLCERTILAALGGGCQLPVGAYAEWRGGELYVRAAVVSPDGIRVIRTNGSGSAAVELGRGVAEELLSQGAREILA